MSRSVEKLIKERKNYKDIVKVSHSDEIEEKIDNRILLVDSKLKSIYWNSGAFKPNTLSIKQDNSNTTTMEYLNSSWVNFLDKHLDLSEIKTQIEECISVGYVPEEFYMWLSETGFPTILYLPSNEIIENPEILFNFIYYFIKGNPLGRVFSIVYKKPPEISRKLGTDNAQFFAFHPSDKDHPLFKDIWIDVYN